ncbi:predicted protein [Chaetomium globosum CBS 148.51]|uniref:Uncharacterized protein n=1 Tax=Chaetomium globosum (strain ATCC 6205 / CBS 148.51 / DSM 1962 / NBRC 6347 / NRRL 1970) TaxID=306901 RepID=Q2HI39_CHAGB|nr:uncharacterized protein CHGG_00115 [Chaetomium globosum CBS 148.51]EAQ91880.1 predicted protein [Chaetomium globosum CBS 148.51]
MRRDMEEQTPPPTILLRLPPPLRHRVYLHIGIARRDGRPYTYYLNGRKESREIVSAFDPPPTRNFMGLLQSCRALYTEAAALLYSANQFVIHAHKASVEPLRALSPTAIASLTSLKIVLNETSCHSPINSSSYPPVCCCDDVERQPHPNSVRAYCARYHKMHHRPLLDPVSSGTDPSSPKSAAQALLTNWHDAAVHLSPHVRPGHLQLSLVCDEVTWSRRFFRYQVCPPACHHYEHTCEPHIHHGCRLNQCLGVEPSARPAPSPGCFCRRRHAAFSSTCNCWDPPTSLFLVCRVLYRDAQLVFFSRNRFIVHDVQASPYWALDSITLGNEPEDSETASTAVDYPYGRLAASHFLRDAIPIDCLAHLRFLELVFPPYGPHDWPVDQHPAIVDWRNTVKWLRCKINTPALTERVVFADFFNDPAAHRWQTTQDEELQIVRGYMDIAQSLRALVQHDGLASLFVQAAFPWSWGEAVTRRAAHPDSWWIQQLAEEEQRLKERLEGIPGREGLVDSRRKPEPGRSNWQTCTHLALAPTYDPTHPDHKQAPGPLLRLLGLDRVPK